MHRALRRGVPLAFCVVLISACSNHEEQPNSEAAATAAKVAAPGENVSTAGKWGRKRTELYIAASEDVPGLEKCLSAVIDADGDRSTEPLAKVEKLCEEEAARLPDGPCKEWAIAASEVGFRFRLFEEDDRSDYTLGRLRKANSAVDPKAIACNAALDARSERADRR